MTSKAEQKTVNEARAMLRVAVDMVFDAGLFAEQARDKTDEDEAYVAIGKAADALVAAAKREAFEEAALTIEKPDPWTEDEQRRLDRSDYLHKTATTIL